MLCKALVPTMVALALAWSWPVSSAMVSADGIRARTGPATLAQLQRGRYGPYATVRRANEVANHFRSLGFKAQVYPEQGAYYVNVW
jgi:hypothetical protein